MTKMEFKVIVDIDTETGNEHWRLCHRAATEVQMGRADWSFVGRVED